MTKNGSLLPFQKTKKAATSENPCPRANTSSNGMRGATKAQKIRIHSVRFSVGDSPPEVLFTVNSTWRNSGNFRISSGSYGYPSTTFRSFPHLSTPGTIPVQVPPPLRRPKALFITSFYGAGDGNRTRDVQLGKLAFYR